MWTLFWDMHSGGGSKEDYDLIFVELPEEDAVTWFYNRFGHNPNRVSCTCCGNDYSISEEEDFEQVAGYHMGWHYDSQAFVEEAEFEDRDDVLVVRRGDVKEEELRGEVPEQGYVWVD
jgi:hypothetical protein